MSIKFRINTFERIVLYNQFGDYERAGQLLSKRKFHPWEGGEARGKIQLKAGAFTIDGHFWQLAPMTGKPDITAWWDQ